MAEHLRYGHINPGDIRYPERYKPEKVCIYSGCPREAAGKDEACLFHLGKDPDKRARPQYEQGVWFG